MRLESDGNMEVHITKMMELVDKLRAMGDENFADKYAVAFLLNSLPDEYNGLLTALDSVKEEDLTISYVRDRLIGEWQKKSDNNESREMALKVSSKETRNGNCYFCGESGHIKRKCPKFRKWLDNRKSNGGGGRQTAKCVTQKETSDMDDKWVFFFKTKHEVGSWYVDSGASCHMSNDKKFFEQLDSSHSEEVYVADGHKLAATGIGDGYVDFVGPGGKLERRMTTDVLLVPELQASLLSVKVLTRKGFEVNFGDDHCKIIRKGVVVAIADAVGNLYKLRQVANVAALVTKPKSDCIHGWHETLGHRDMEAIKMLPNLADGVKIVECRCLTNCEPCIRGKMSRLPFPAQSKNKAKEILDLVHTDVCGPMQTITPGGRRYFVTFIDDFSKFCYIYLLKRKSEVYNKVVEFVEMVKNVYGKKPKTIRADRGGEYKSFKVIKYLKKEGICRQYTAAYTPQQNGTAERKNRYIMEMARSMLFGAELDNKYWGEAVLTANFIQNRLPSRPIDKTPYELWTGNKPDLSFMQKFGADCYAYVPQQLRRKLDEKAIRLKFVGYDRDTKGYRLVNTITGKVTISRDVKFLRTVERVKSNVENEEPTDVEFYFGDSEDPKPIEDEEEFESFIDENNVTQPDMGQAEPEGPRRSARSN